MLLAGFLVHAPLPALWSDQPAFLNAVQKVVASCRARGLPYGTLAPNADGTKARIADGFTFIGMGSDINHMLAALAAQRKGIE